MSLLRPVRASVLVFVLVAAATLVRAGDGAAQPPAPAAPQVIDGPDAAIRGLSGVAVARDGTGGLVYVKAVAGVPHVFASALTGGAFQPPVQVDSGLAGASSQPVIAAGDNGLLLIAFINAGDLMVADRTGASGPFGPPQTLYAMTAANPSIAAEDPPPSASIESKAYLAFTTGTAGAHDVRAAYFANDQWTLANGILDSNPSDDAGTGHARPDVVAAGDGVGIVAWGEAGHVFARRVLATSPSVLAEQADGPPAGVSEVSSDLPAVGVADDSSYAQVIFHELVTDGSAQQSRVLMRRLHGSAFEGIVGVDGLSSPGSVGAVQPAIAMTPAADGIATSARDTNNDLYAGTLAGNGIFQNDQQVNSGASFGLPYAAPTGTGNFSGMVAWQEQPSGIGSTQITERFYDGSNFSPEQVVSSATLGSTAAASGLWDDGDVAGDVAIGWIQGSGSATQVVVDQLYQPPGGFAGSAALAYVRSVQPVLAWSSSRELWGPLTYTLAVDGTTVGQTVSTSLTVPAPLANGPHRWQVTAANPAGESAATKVATVWVDNVAPQLQLTLAGAERPRVPVRLTVRDSDAPFPVPRAAASGIAKVTVVWGDGTSTTVVHGASHAYPRSGRYRLSVTAVDRAGNRNTAVLHVRVIAAPARRR